MEAPPTSVVRLECFARILALPLFLLGTQPPEILSTRLCVVCYINLPQISSPLFANLFLFRANAP